MHIGAVIDLLRDAVLLGWAATALFCGVAGVAVAVWGRIRWPLGLLAGLVLLYLGLALVLLAAAVRVQQRVRSARAARTAALPAGVGGPPAVGPPAVMGAAAPVAVLAPSSGHRPVPAGSGVRLAARRGWVRWTRTPPTRAEYAVAVGALVVAVALVVVTQLTWVKLSALGYGVVGVGAFEIQLGLFAVLAALAAVVCAIGVLRSRSAWWPVLLAWFGSWWLFVTGEVLLSARGSLDDLNRLLGDQVRERFDLDARPQLQLGVGWTVMAGLAVVMMVLAIALLVLQGRRTSHYRPETRS